MAIRGIWKYKGDEAGLTGGKDYAGFNVGDSVYVVTDEGRMRPINICSPAWELLLLNVDGETVYQREDEKDDGEGNGAEGRDAAKAEAGEADGAGKGEENRQGQPDEGRRRGGQEPVE